MQTVISSEEVGVDGVSNSNVKPSALISKEVRCGKMTLYVKSKRKYMGTRLVSIPAFVPGNPPLLVNSARRIAVYEDYLDEEQTEAVKNTKMLATNLCVELEVHDVAHSNFFAKFLGLFFRTKFMPNTPSLSFENEGLVSLVSSNYSKQHSIQ